MRFIAFAATLVCALLACEAPPAISFAEGEGESEGPLPATSYCEELAPLFCPFYLRCGRMDVASLDECLASFAPSCEARFEPRFLPLAERGLVALSRAGLDACAAHLDDVACDEQFFELEGPCATIWEGQVAAGGACGLDIETFVCAPGTACTLDLSFCGTCETILDDGAACRIGDEGAPGTCGPGGECGDDDACVVRPTVGEACTDDGPSCALPARCQSGVCRHPTYVGVGNACDSQRRCPYLTECTGGVCTATVPGGGACEANAECDAGFFCQGGVCAALIVDGACTDDDACASGVCEDGRCAAFATRCVAGD